ncbi:MAG: acetyltransferase [Peptococcaceae bacterium]|nr:acetyltransferase [Peptococcaceae bacterium]
MKFYETIERDELLINKLLSVWEKSVTATHLFLSKEEIAKIAEFVPTALQEIPHLIVAMDTEECPIAFMGIAGNKLEMLFITPEQRGNGIGRKLLEHAIKNYAVNELCVNEQNPQAKGFYQHMGFQVYQRTETDEQGNPYPILYMKLAE